VGLFLLIGWASVSLGTDAFLTCSGVLCLPMPLRVTAVNSTSALALDLIS